MTIDQAKTGFMQAKERLCRVLATTPEDRLNWAPSSTARTPLQVVVHAADAIKHLNETLKGNTFAVPTTAEADKSFREWERQFRTREEVLSLLESNSAAYIAWLDELSVESLESIVSMPFGLPAMPISACLTFPIQHTNEHTAQIEYIQTIYGDYDWYL